MSQLSISPAQRPLSGRGSSALGHNTASSQSFWCQHQERLYWGDSRKRSDGIELLLVSWNRIYYTKTKDVCKNIWILREGEEIEL